MRFKAAFTSWPDYVLAGTIGMLVLLAWWTLWLWGKSPGGHLLMHGSAHLASAQDGLWRLSAVFVSGWTLMTVAMMLPTALPLLLMFRRMVHGKPNAALLVGLVVGGYLGVWLLFGVLALWASRIMQQGWQHIGWLARSPWIFGAAMLTAAGFFQFSPLKYACLEKCRTPMSFIVSRWRGGDARRQALRIGVEHGVFCVGCCWSLMLLMFLVGAGNLGWMLLLGVVMALEKNFPWGRRVSAPVGGLLLLGAALVTYSGIA